ncbi:MAG: sodium:proton antiporter [Methylococcales symbiont of Iophon sp. n. MRB-2018]|nr:MAG: sodium:proton antiporter [Methylococcales symbiont of Iophon sp. n. MRB-2018]KAF3979116.1 MAG: sodium:proton antiporter [Methylococcales symbiont of Iophon sp. n. MRB-2018]
MNLDIYLAIFTLLFISLGVNVLALKLRIPYTVLLVIAGSLLVPFSQIEFFSFITTFQLTPELLFFVFLPVLIFESAYNIKVRNIKDNKIAISLLAIVGLLISTVFIGYVGYWGFQWLGFQIPLLVTLLFGAIISATDPVAVLALFKEIGAPRRLTLIFEGESLFNDGTAFAIFIVLLDVIVHGFHGYSTVLQGFITFSTMIVGGTLFGLFMGGLFSKLIARVKGHENLEITLTLLVAHFTFLLSEVISEYWIINGHNIHISSIIATLISSMVLGNYGRFKMSSGVEEYMDKFWGYFAFVSNSLVFLLMGLLFTSLTISLHIAWLPILMIILVVVIARAISIYLSIGIHNQFKSEEKIPLNWQHLMAWGSLRGSLALIMVLLIPDNMTLPDWPYDFSIKEFIIAITIGSIYFTLLVKANTIGRMVRWLKIDALLAYEKLSYHKGKALIYMNIIKKSKELMESRQISAEQHQKFTEYYQRKYKKNYADCETLNMDSTHLAVNMLRIYTLGIQIKELKMLFRYDEVSESIYKKNLNILETQIEKVEQDSNKLKSLNAYLTNWAGAIDKRFRKLFFLSEKKVDGRELYLYYQTQYILISKVLEVMGQLKDSHLMEVFNDTKAISNVTQMYQGLLKVTEQKMQEEIKSNQDMLDYLNEQSAIYLLQAVQTDTLNELQSSEIISKKLQVILDKELNNW